MGHSTSKSAKTVAKRTAHEILRMVFVWAQSEKNISFKGVTYNPVTKVDSLNQDTAVNSLAACRKSGKFHASTSSTPSRLLKNRERDVGTLHAVTIVV